MTLTFNRKPRKSFIRRVLEWIVTILLALIVALFIVSNIISLTQIMEESMEPTLSPNDRVIVYKLGLNFNEAESGDIIILNRDIERKGLIKNMINEAASIIDNINYRLTGEIEKNNLVKRVVGIEGDIINIEDGKLYINNEIQREDYIKGSTFPQYGISYPLEVPEGKVFVLGDNREDSLDSRSFGLIGNEQIKGKVVYRILPLSRFGSVK